MTETWPFKDIDARPKRGRYFPFAFQDLAHAAVRWGLQDENNIRVRICFVNETRIDTSAFLFAEYRPHQVLTIYSWGDNMPLTAAKTAVAKAFPIFSPLKRISTPNGKNNFAGCYLLRLQPNGEMRLTECKIHFEQGKYSGSQKFSNAFKKRVTKIEERTLPLHDSIELDLELTIFSESVLC